MFCNTSATTTKLQGILNYIARIKKPFVDFRGFSIKVLNILLAIFKFIMYVISFLNKIIPLKYYIENQLLIINIVELSKMKTKMF